LASKINLLGVHVDALSVDELHERIGAAVAKRDHLLVLYVNAHGLNLSYEHRWLREFLNQAAVVGPDGVGVAVAARMLGERPPERIALTDWIWDLGGFAAERDMSLFLVGGAPGVAERAADELRRRHPRVRVVGTHHGYFDKAREGSESRLVVDAINAAHPDILLVGFGMPIQEHWIKENWAGIDAAVGITGGAVMDYVSGTTRRGPAWMTGHGLEWLSRLVIEPRRLWRRYLLGNPVFLLRILRQRLRMGRLSPRKDAL
jgi:N-acetylglucosaminyldiphosphoundecaprenol N-acetyl-beta-D-mannosaminyltransferase